MINPRKINSRMKYYCVLREPRGFIRHFSLFCRYSISLVSDYSVLNQFSASGLFRSITFFPFSIHTLTNRKQQNCYLTHFFTLFTISFVIQQVYMYFRGSGKAAQMKREAARGAVRAAIWCCGHVEPPRMMSFFLDCRLYMHLATGCG